MHRRLQRDYQMVLFHSIVFSALPVYHGLSPRRWGGEHIPSTGVFVPFPISKKREQEPSAFAEWDE